MISIFKTSLDIFFHEYKTKYNHKRNKTGMTILDVIVCDDLNTISPIHFIKAVFDIVKSFEMFRLWWHSDRK